MRMRDVTVTIEDELDLDGEIAHADHLAEILRFALNWGVNEDCRNLIAVSGTQITVGEIIEGALARHDLRRKANEAD